MSLQFRSYILSALALTAIAAATATASAENVKIAFIDPLSGSFGGVGNNGLHTFQYVAEIANKEKWAGNTTLEVIGFDNKGSPQESLSVLKSVIGQGIRYVTSGGSSGASLAMVDAINKHNERNPGKELVMLNYSSVDPDLTNSKCSFWHFRYDPHIDMKTEAMTSAMAKNRNIKKVYLIGQNYVSGIRFNSSAKEQIMRKRPDIQIVGNDLHPIGQIKDFSPYIAKIKASGADSVITGNWGPDLSLLIKAAKDADLKVDFYTFYASLMSTPASIGAAGVDHVKYATVWQVNNETFAGEKIAEGFLKKYGEELSQANPYSVISSLTKAIKNTGSSNPVKVAFALEEMTVKTLAGDGIIRKDDHQMQQPIYVATWTHTNGKDVKYDQESTGYGWKTEEKIAANVAAQPTSCQMRRPVKS